MNEIDSTLDWSNIANNNDLFEHTVDATAKLGGSFEVIGRNSEVSGLLQQMNENDISSTIETSSNIFRVKLKSKDNFSEEGFIESYDSLRTQLLLREKSQIYSAWLNNEKSNIEVKDLRSKIY